MATKAVGTIHVPPALAKLRAVPAAWLGPTGLEQ